MLMGLVLAVVASLLFGQGMHGWGAGRGLAQVGSPAGVAIAAHPGGRAAGVLLALAGTLLQRVSNNPMASPELLG